MGPLTVDPRASFHRSALLGAAVWLPGTLAFRIGLAESLLLAGALVAVPLGLALALSGQGPPTRRLLVRILSPGALPAAVALLASFALPPGLQAALLAVPWLAFTAVAALASLDRLCRAVREGRPTAADLAVAAGPTFLAVGGVWALASRAGVRFLGFGEPIVLLTAAHFHFAGFVLPILAGLAARALRTRLAAAGALAATIGAPLTAAGITLSHQHGLPWAELGAALWMVAAAALLAALQLWLFVRARGSASGALWALSGASLIAAMALAAAYALGRFLGKEWLDIRTMIELHATTNVLGFALPGLLAWTLELRASKDPNSFRPAQKDESRVAAAADQRAPTPAYPSHDTSTRPTQSPQSR